MLKIVYDNKIYGGANMPINFKSALCAGATILAIAAGFVGQAQSQTAICYNCPPEWADWRTQLRVIKDATGITVPPDNKNSGQALAQLLAEKDNPVADVAHFGVGFAIQAKKDRVIE